jgi:uncharacterized protein YqfA (UPF0365 family)
MAGLSVGSFLLGVAFGVAISLGGIIWLVVNRSWRRAMLSGIPVSFGDVLGMRLRGTPPGLVVDAAVALDKRGLSVSIREVEAAYLAYGTPRMNHLHLAETVQREAVEVSPFEIA